MLLGIWSFWDKGKQIFNLNPQSHVERIAEHALAMKAVDPTIKVFWNDNNQSPSRLKDFLATAGDAVDGAEFHGKGGTV